MSAEQIPADIASRIAASNEDRQLRRNSVRLANAAPELLAELQNIANAKRFSREHFADDSAFCDWAQSRARAAIARATSQPEGGA